MEEDLAVEEFHAAIGKERRDARNAGKLFADACRADDVNMLFQAVDALDMTIGGLPHAFRRLLKLQSAHLSLETRRAFLQVWIENKSIGNNFDGCLFLLTDGLRKLLPPYEGSGVRLYRGAFWRERVGRAYGLSWTSDIATAEKFATDTRRHSRGGSCILETDAPAKAILGSMEEVGDYYNENEYLVDRRLLGAVRVERRYDELPLPSFGYSTNRATQVER